MVERLSPAEAATAIVHLINTSPRTPWPAEIEAITARIATIAPATALTLPDHVVAYHDRARQFLRQSALSSKLRSADPTYEAENNRTAEMSRRLDEVGDVILGTCRSVGRSRWPRQHHPA
jgi:hypothetical protein